MKEVQSTQDPETAALRDCESLIARIDGTLAALARERTRLEAQARSLRPAPEAEPTLPAHDHEV